jgi:hypothetical protein
MMDMNRLERLPEITDHILSGLVADDQLKHRILLSSATQNSGKKVSLRTVIALCSLSAVLILLCIFGIRSGNSGELQVISAGSRHSSPPVKLESVLEKAAELSNP